MDRRIYRLNLLHLFRPSLPQLHQQTLLRPPPGLSMPPSMQQPMQYSGFNAPFPTGAANLPSLSPLVTSNPDTNAVIPPISNKTNAISGPTLPYQTISQPISSIVGSLGTSSSSQTETPTPLLVTPGQLLQFSPSSTSVSAQIHPLVVFNSCDCYVRRPDQAERIIGGMIFVSRLSCPCFGTSANWVCSVYGSLGYYSYYWDWDQPC